MPGDRQVRFPAPALPGSGPGVCSQPAFIREHPQRFPDGDCTRFDSGRPRNIEAINKSRSGDAGAGILRWRQVAAFWLSLLATHVLTERAFGQPLNRVRYNGGPCFGDTGAAVSSVEAGTSPGRLTGTTSNGRLRARRGVPANCSVPAECLPKNRAGLLGSIHAKVFTQRHSRSPDLDAVVHDRHTVLDRTVIVPIGADLRCDSVRYKGQPRPNRNHVAQDQRRRFGDGPVGREVLDEFYELSPLGRHKPIPGGREARQGYFQVTDHRAPAGAISG
jgi:hypothetical protein